MSIRILFVEDEPSVRDVLLETVACGYQAECVSTAEEAIERLTQEAFEIIVTEIMLPGMSGLELLSHCPRLRPGIITIAITRHGTIEMAVEAMKRGATDFLTKPFAPEDLQSTIRVAAERVSRHALSVTGAGIAAVAIVAKSLAMRKVL